MENNEKINKTNKIFSVIIILLVISVLAFGAFLIRDKVISKKSNEDKKEDIIKYEEEVRVDASLATQPLTDAYKKGLDNFNIKLDYTNTDPAYTKLINNETDLIIVTEPSEEEKKRAKDKGVEL